MNNRPKFLAAGRALAALSALPRAKADQQHRYPIYLHGIGGRLVGPSVEGLAVTIGAAVFSGAGQATGLPLPYPTPPGIPILIPI